MSTTPLVTILVAVHDGERFLPSALASALGQTVRNLELLVVDDGSTDGTGAIVSALDDPRVRVLRNDERLGLAASLNRGLDEARGQFVARLDADDVAFPDRVETQLRHLSAHPRCSVVGSAVLELAEDDRPGRLHLMPTGAVAVRFAALFSAPFFHPTVMVDRAALDRHGLRYDEAFAESEDYELWARLLEHGDGDNLAAPEVLYRVHPGQASQRRRPLQRELQVRVAQAQIAATAPALSSREAELAWAIGASELDGISDAEEAADAYVRLVEAFERRWGRDARPRAARDLARLARRAGGGVGARIAGRAARLDPAAATRDVRLRRRRRGVERSAREAAERWLAALGGDSQSPIRVTAVFPEPTPYRSPLLDRIAALPTIDLTVVYSAESVVGRAWRADGTHRAIVLHGARIPGAERLVRHDYPVTPSIVGELRRTAPDVVVVSGWSTFAAQMAIGWCRARGVPYVLVVESHDEGPRPGWRRAVKGTVVPRLIQGASGILVTGTLARSSMLARGAAHERVRVFANTIDVDAFEHRADRLAERRRELRAELGCDADDVIVLSVGRLAPEKRYDVLIRAVAEAGDSSLALVLVGDGPEREALQDLGRDLGARLVLTGDRPWEKMVEAYVAADVFALLSERETWGVVVNEAAACGLPLVLSDRVGAAHDLLRDGDNGVLVPAGDVPAAAAALAALAADPVRRKEMGARSRELARDWGYGPSVDGFLAAVREAFWHRR